MNARHHAADENTAIPWLSVHISKERHRLQLSRSIQIFDCQLEYENAMQATMHLAHVLEISH